jgi:mycofactocin system creatininase family protein
VSGLGDRTSPDIGRERPVVLIPLGSTEQHGPHLPIDTDTRIAVAICEQAAAALAGSPTLPAVRVAPAVAYGASGEHQGFAGTLSIGQDALERVVVELARSAGADYPLVVVINGHGGNAEPLARARATLEHERRPVVVWSPRLVDGDSHAGRTETSVLLALAPEVVQLGRAEPGVTTPLPELLADLRAGGLVAVSPNGVLGDPTGATAEEGRAILDAWVADLAATITDALAPHPNQ